MRVMKFLFGIMTTERNRSVKAISMSINSFVYYAIVFVTPS